MGGGGDGRSDEERQSTADALVARFLADGAPQQVCVGRADEFASSLATLSKEMFAPAVEVARAALALDIWPRFEETAAWRALAERASSKPAAATTPSAREATASRPSRRQASRPRLRLIRTGARRWRARSRCGSAPPSARRRGSTSPAARGAAAASPRRAATLTAYGRRW